MKIIVIPTAGDHCESVTTKINVKILIKNLQECFFFLSKLLPYLQLIIHLKRIKMTFFFAFDPFFSGGWVVRGTLLLHNHPLC